MACPDPFDGAASAIRSAAHDESCSSGVLHLADSSCRAFQRQVAMGGHLPIVGAEAQTALNVHMLPVGMGELTGFVTTIVVFVRDRRGILLDVSFSPPQPLSLLCGCSLTKPTPEIPSAVLNPLAGHAGRGRFREPNTHQFISMRLITPPLLAPYGFTLTFPPPPPPPPHPHAHPTATRTRTHLPRSIRDAQVSMAVTRGCLNIIDVHSETLVPGQEAAFQFTVQVAPRTLLRFPRADISGVCFLASAES